MKNDQLQKGLLKPVRQMKKKGTFSSQSSNNIQEVLFMIILQLKLLAMLTGRTVYPK